MLTFFLVGLPFVRLSACSGDVIGLAAGMVVARAFFGCRASHLAYEKKHHFVIIHQCFTKQKNHLTSCLCRSLIGIG